MDHVHRPPTKSDLTGRRFGRLTALGPAENAGNYAVWRCRCDCGSETVVAAPNLTSGRTRSCGCLKRELNDARRLDLTGRKFGRLTALGPAENIGKDTAWNCRCDCGNEVVAKTVNLTSGSTRSCGCLVRDARKTRRMDLTGRRFGILTVLGPAGYLHGRLAWKCRCDCGNETVVRGTSLTHGDTKSCGCMAANRPRTKPGWKTRTAAAGIR